MLAYIRFNGFPMVTDQTAVWRRMDVRRRRPVRQEQRSTDVTCRPVTVNQATRTGRPWRCSGGWEVFLGAKSRSLEASWRETGGNFAAQIGGRDIDVTWSPPIKFMGLIVDCCYEYCLCELICEVKLLTCWQIYTLKTLQWLLWIWLIFMASNGV